MYCRHFWLSVHWEEKDVEESTGGSKLMCDATDAVEVFLLVEVKGPMTVVPRRVC